jgi:metal-responsive CopG/Arc/MetJ family transcriptional regulator
MSQTLATISFSVDKKIQQEMDEQAAEEGRSKSDIFREMYRQYRLRQLINRMQALAAPVVEEFNLRTDDDIARFIREN